jgi:hypothetical protein
MCVFLKRDENDKEFWERWWIREYLIKHRTTYPLNYATHTVLCTIYLQSMSIENT